MTFKQTSCTLAAVAVAVLSVTSLAAPGFAQAAKDPHAKTAVAGGETARAREPDVLRKSNLVAWCIVPFDIKHRGPEARAEMLGELGIGRFAYDWRPKNIPSFDREVDAVQSHHIRLIAFWLPAGSDPAHDPHVQAVLSLLRRRHLRLQLWVMYTPDEEFSSLTQSQKVARAAKTISYLSSQAGETGSSVALYNHGGWWGEPDNELAVLAEVHRPNVGLVYNFNHAQGQIKRFPEFFPEILPHLLAINLAGLREGSPRTFPIGQGGSEKNMISIVWKSSYRGPIGIINELTDPDAKKGLEINMAGLERVLAEIGDEEALASYR